MKDLLLHKVQGTIDRHRMLGAGEIVVVAVSGGIDSMVLLHLLLDVRHRYQIALHVAHLNHDLRGAEAAEAADFVRRYCEAQQVPVTVLTADGRTLRDRRAGSLQAAARDLRYRFFEQVAGEQGARKIALGHHCDDQAETVLMNLLRGSGTRGLGGIPPVRDRIIRPLIECSREEIERYAGQQGIPYVEDSSNHGLVYSRNRIRLELLPELAKRYNPRIAHTLASTATILEAEDALLQRMTEQELPAVLLSTSDERLVVSVPRMTSLPTALRWRLIRRLTEGLRDGRAGLSFQQTLAIDRLMLSDGLRGHVQTPGRLHATRIGDCLVFSIGDINASNQMPIASLVVPGLTVIPQYSLSLRSDVLEKRVVNELPSDAWTVLVDAERAGQDLQVRGWQPGDRFVPLGLHGRKKLQDFFVDEKVSRDRRERIPLVISGDQIVWVVGFRLDERFKITDSTRRILRMRATMTGSEV